MTTIVDVARAAGVSTATVSRVLNHHPQVDPRLAANVLQVIKTSATARAGPPAPYAPARTGSGP